MLSVPAVEKKRYYSVMLCDGNTFNYGYIGSRATGNEAGDYMVVGPDWKGETPPGIKKVFRSTTQFSLAAYRTQLFNPDDMPNVVKVQSGYKVQPLSAYLEAAGAARGAGDRLPEDRQGDGQDELLRVPRLRAAVRAAGTGGRGDPREAGHASASAPGKTFDFKDLSLEHKAAVAAGHEGGRRRRSRSTSPTGVKKVNGWNIGSCFGDRAFYNGNWLLRAAAAKGGIYGNDAVEATYPMTKTLADGEPLDGSKHNYTLTFAAGPVPAGQRVLVGDDVRRQDAAPDQESDQPLPDQLADAAGA